MRSASRQLNFGAFLSDQLAVRLSFLNADAYEYFQRLYRNPGQIPPPPNETTYHQDDAVVLGTALEHEIRHFHDFLLSWHAFEIFKRRAENCLNVQGLLVLLNSAPWNAIPFPLARWALMDQAEKRNFQEYAGHYFGLGRLSLPDIHFSHDELVASTPKGTTIITAEFSPENVRNLIGIIMRSEASISRLISGWPNTSLRIEPLHVYELSAILVQLQSMRRTYGLQFGPLDALLSNPDSVYGRAFLLLKGVLNSTLDLALLSLDHLSSIITWALTGFAQPDDPKLGCPAWRLTTLSAAFTKEKYARTLLIDDLRSRFKAWDELLGTYQWNRGLLGHIMKVGMWKDKYDSSMAPDGWRNEVAAMRRILEALHKAVAAATHKFIHDPNGYVSLDQYVTKGMAAYPQPSLIYDIKGGAYFFQRPDATDSELDAYVPLVWNEGQKETRITQLLFKSGDIPSEDVLWYSSMIGFSDFLFAPERLDKAEFDETKKMLEQATGKRLLRIV